MAQWGLELTVGNPRGEVLNAKSDPETSLIRPKSPDSDAEYTCFTGESCDFDLLR